MPHLEGFKIDGEVVPSVTEIIGLIQKPWKEKWQRKVGFEESDKIMNEAADLGREAHSMVDEYLKNGRIGTCGRSEKARLLFDRWHDWWTTSIYHLVGSEKHLVSLEKKYHGSCDAIITSGSLDIIVDWKFSKSEDPLRVLQLAGYAYALWEETGEKPNRGLVIRVDPKTLKVYEKHYKGLWKYTKLFLALRKLYDLAKGKVKP